MRNRRPGAWTPRPCRRSPSLRWYFGEKNPLLVAGAALLLIGGYVADRRH
ncbi:MAG: hypothetical protein ABEJ77_05730 [Halanaeroarchaeum sp.]